ncbi:MAG TPA: DUF6526 family protein [Holophagaceae bacterium]
MAAPQTYANHRRFDPLFHFALLPFFLVAWLVSVVYLVRHPGLHHALLMLAALAFLLLALLVRGYALKVQDRVIRLEERLRMERLLPEDLKARIPELTVRQCVGLRFASDAELADRVREALAEGLKDEAIKKRIQSWRPDTHRV